MSTLLEALERAEQALREVQEIAGEMSDLSFIVEDAHGTIKDHIADLRDGLKPQDKKRLKEWNQSFQYRPRHQEETRIP